MARRHTIFKQLSVHLARALVTCPRRRLGDCSAMPSNEVNQQHIDEAYEKVSKLLSHPYSKELVREVQNLIGLDPADNAVNSVWVSPCGTGALSILSTSRGCNGPVPVGLVPGTSLVPSLRASKEQATPWKRPRTSVHKNQNKEMKT